MHLSTTLNSSLPKLAWLARADLAHGELHVEHGAAVEVGARFVVEGVWDGPFADAAFHRTQAFFGSGLKLDDESFWLVPSRALVDRIVYYEEDSHVIASNSLPLLMAATGATLDPAWDYRRETFTILRGVQEYDSNLHLLHRRDGHFQQLFYHARRFGPQGRPKPPEQGSPSFSSFDEYVHELRTVLTRIRANAGSSDRRNPLAAYTTVSAGYDSTAVTALVHDLDVTAAFTRRRSNSSIKPWMSRAAAIDDGTPIAEHFGLRVLYLDKPKDIQMDELHFLAPSAADPELAFYALARHIEGTHIPAILFTGFHGDKVWDKATTGPYLDAHLRRGDTSGFNLSEIRLKAGFMNVAVPFIFSERIADIVTISRSVEMKPWQIGGDYDRPIPRRIAEEAGLERTAFGTRKKAVVQRYNYPVNNALRNAFFDRLRVRFGWSPAKIYTLERVNSLLFLASTAIDRFLGMVGRPTSLSRTTWVGGEMDLPYELHTWALEALALRYRKATVSSVTTPTPDRSTRS